MAATNKQFQISLPRLVRQLLFSWLLAVLIEYILLPSELRSLTELEGLSYMSLPRVVLITLSGTVLLFMASQFAPILRPERWGMPIVFGALATLNLVASFSWAFLTACLLILGALGVYCIRGWNSSQEPDQAEAKGKAKWKWVTATLAFLFFLFVSLWTVTRIYSYSTPTFDFGIFAQMYHNMAESGLPMTTVERDGLLSHFHVHMSPIYYLLLPIYWLFPYPATLQILQAAVMTSAVIPLWKLGKHYGLKDPPTTLLCAVLLLFPAFSGGASYDIHENCFLTPLILWLFYGVSKKNTLLTGIFAVLTLTVKEDAAVYVAVIALWVTVKSLLKWRKENLRELVTGLSLLAFSLLWFFCTTKFLATVGDGVMTYRYDNFMYDGSSSLITVIKSVILNPLKALYECVDPEKLKYIGLTMLPLLGLPLLTRRYERYILLIPYLLVNLMSDYQYQHDVFFQYNFGSAAFLLFLTVMNLADMKLPFQKLTALVLCTAVSAGCFCSVIVPKAKYYPEIYLEYRDHYTQIRETLSCIPDDASVTAATFYTTQLSQREVLYDIRYAAWENVLQTEYVVLKKSSTGDFKKYKTNGQNNGFENLIQKLEANGYSLYEQMGTTVLIYKKG